MSSLRINNLKKYRRIAGYTQKDVALILDITYTAGISKWEKGFLLPCTEHLFILSHLYNALPNELYPSLWESLKQEAAEKKSFLPSKKKRIESHHFYL
jgi:transcriptional regulator with XRE-family HTH domain